MSGLGTQQGGNLGYDTYVVSLTPTTQQSGISAAPLIIGEVYTIASYEVGDDFSNIANVISGTINTNGCIFRATGTTPAVWTEGSLLDGSGSPIPTILENTTIGIPAWFQSETIGNYYAELTGWFTGKTPYIAGYTSSDSSADNLWVSVYNGGVVVGYYALCIDPNNQIILECYDTNQNSIELTTLTGGNDLFLPEIRAYH